MASAIRSAWARLSASLPGWPRALAAVVTAALWTAFPETATRTARFALDSLMHMAPVITLAVILAAGLRASGADALASRAFEGRSVVTIITAALIGALTPICGVGVLPLIAGLLRAGVPLAPIMAFWLASPVTDPAMLTITAGTLGPHFAIGKTVIAFAIGLIGGALTAALSIAGGLRNPMRGYGLVAEACAVPLPGGRLVPWFWRDESRRALFGREARATAVLMLKWLTIAFVLEGVVRQHLPAELVAQIAGRRSQWAIPLAVLIGTPIYLDGYAALPLVRGLIDMGMTPGAAMAFLVAGGITSLYASVAVYALVRLPVFAWYLLLAIVLSLASGYAYQALPGVQP